MTESPYESDRSGAEEPDHLRAGTNSAAVTAQDEDYQGNSSRPSLQERVRHWERFLYSGLGVGFAGVMLIVSGHFTKTYRAMDIGGFFIFSGAVLFTAGVLGKWLTRANPLD